MNEKKFTKLSELVDKEFTIEKVWGYKWKLWDNESKRMLVSETFEKGYRKIYGLNTSEGSLDVSASQLGQMLESVQKDGVSDLNGQAFSVKSNGKTGMDIRYYINPVRGAKKQDSDEPFPSSVTEEELNNLGW
jgi:hypothetical protein